MRIMLCISRQETSLPVQVWKAMNLRTWALKICCQSTPKYTGYIWRLFDRTSHYRRSIIHVLAVILSSTCHFFFFCQNIFIRVIRSCRKKCPLAMYQVVSSWFWGISPTVYEYCTFAVYDPPSHCHADKYLGILFSGRKASNFFCY